MVNSYSTILQVHCKKVSAEILKYSMNVNITLSLRK